MSKNSRRPPSNKGSVCFVAALLLPTLIALSACVPIPVGRHEVELTERVETTAVEEIRSLRVAPFYGEEALAALGKGLRKTCPNAEILPAHDLWAILFPNRDPDADAELGELIDMSAQHANNAGIAGHLIILRRSHAEYREPVSEGKSSPFFYQGTNAATVVTTLVRLGPFAGAQSFSVDAEGKDTIVWFGHPVFHLSISSKPGRKAIGAISAAIGHASDCIHDPGLKAVLLAGAES